MLEVLTLNKPSLIDGETDNDPEVTLLDQVIRGGTPAAILCSKVEHGFHSPEGEPESEGDAIFIEILSPELKVCLSIAKAQPVMYAGQVIVVFVNVGDDLSAKIHLPAVHQ